MNYHEATFNLLIIKDKIVYYSIICLDQDEELNKELNPDPDLNQKQDQDLDKGLKSTDPHIDQGLDKDREKGFDKDQDVDVDKYAIRKAHW